MSEFIDTFVNFLTLYPRGGAFDSLFCPEGRVFVHNDCPPLQVMYRGFVPRGMVLDEIDSCWFIVALFSISMLFVRLVLPFSQSCQIGGSEAVKPLSRLKNAFMLHPVKMTSLMTSSFSEYVCIIFKLE